MSAFGDTSMTYRFRAECQHDAELFEEQLFAEGIACKWRVDKPDPLFPDVDCTVITSESIERLRNIARSLLNCHVILQTLASEEDYTGDRDYDRV